MRVLGIETSCDETGVAVCDSEGGVLADNLHSQVALHARFGGVVPELASRDHIAKLLPLIEKTLDEAGVDGAVDGIAYTAGPGLVGALLVGASVAQGLALAWGVPVIGVHHMEGHLLAPMLEPGPPPFPFVALLVSGGHTMLVAVEGLGRYRLLGETRDDAAGEAFDKTAKILGLGYPGGPALARLAQQGQPGVFQFPRPMLNRPGLDFSFSGLKTAALYAARDHLGHPALGDEDEEVAGQEQMQIRADIARGFEDAVVDTLVAKCLRALDESGMRRLVVAGGVGANRRLRETLSARARDDGAKVYYPRPEYCTDNGVMIAHIGLLRLQAGQRGGTQIQARARWPLEQLSPP